MIGKEDLSRFEPNIIDMESGYSITIPAIYQLPPFWWEDNTKAYASVRQARRQHGITVDDWDGRQQPTREPEQPSEGDEIPAWALRANRTAPEAQKGV